MVVGLPLEPVYTAVISDNYTFSSWKVRHMCRSTFFFKAPTGKMPTLAIINNPDMVYTEPDTLQTEMSARLCSVRAYMEQHRIDTLVVQNMQDIYWLTGFQTPGAPRCQSLVLTLRRVDLFSRALEVTNATAPTVHVDGVVGYTEGACPVRELLAVIRGSHPQRVVGLQYATDRGTPADMRMLDDLLQRELRCNTVDVSDIIRSLRSPKSQRELAYMRQAGEACSRAMHVAIRTAGVAGATEGSIAGAIACALAQCGGFPAYPPFVAVGNHSALGHYAANVPTTSVQAGDTVFLEIGGCCRRYHTAMMRTCFVGDVVPTDVLVAETCVVRALSAMRAALRPGVAEVDVYAAGASELGVLETLGWTISQRIGYSIGIGFAVDWGEADSISFCRSSHTTTRRVPLGATLHLIPWVRHPVLGAVGISDTVVCRVGGGVSLFPEGKPPEQIILLPPARPQQAEALAVRRFFGHMLDEPTPMRRLSEGLPCDVLIKDESTRLGQLSFKALGSGYAMASAIRKIGPASEFDAMRRKDTEPVLTFVTASDGNHGAGLAWAARQLGHRAIVWFPQGVVQSRIDTATALGATVHVSLSDYDQTVRHVAEIAASNQWVLVQDTAWDGYEAVPRDIMVAYKLVAHEVMEYCDQATVTPTHVLLQVGVGSFAASIVQYMQEHPRGRRATIITIEPVGSAGMLASILHGTNHPATDTASTVSVGLDCHRLSDLAWPILRDHVAFTATVTDSVAERGVRTLYAAGVESGESGAAVGVGFLQSLEPTQRAALGIDPTSVVLVFNTEGNTSPSVHAEILETVPGPTVKYTVRIVQV